MMMMPSSSQGSRNGLTTTTHETFGFLQPMKKQTDNRRVDFHSNGENSTFQGLKFIFVHFIWKLSGEWIKNSQIYMGRGKSSWSLHLVAQTIRAACSLDQCRPFRRMQINPKWAFCFWQFAQKPTDTAGSPAVGSVHVTVSLHAESCCINIKTINTWWPPSPLYQSSEAGWKRKSLWGNDGLSVGLYTYIYKVLGDETCSGNDPEHTARSHNVFLSGLYLRDTELIEQQWFPEQKTNIYPPPI